MQFTKFDLFSDIPKESLVFQTLQISETFELQELEDLGEMVGKKRW